LNGALTQSEEQTTTWNGYTQDSDGTYGEALQINNLQILDNRKDSSNFEGTCVVIAQLGINGAIKLE